MEATATRRTRRARSPDELATQAEKVREVKRARRRLRTAEDKATAIRAERDRLIYEAIEAGASERKAAEAGGVSHTYAHRCAVTEGNPPTGHRQREIVKQ